MFYRLEIWDQRAKMVGFFFFLVGGRGGVLTTGLIGKSRWSGSDESLFSDLKTASCWLCAHVAFPQCMCMERNTRHRIGKETEDLNNTMNQLDEIYMNTLPNNNRIHTLLRDLHFSSSFCKEMNVITRVPLLWPWYKPKHSQRPRLQTLSLWRLEHQHESWGRQTFRPQQVPCLFLLLFAYLPVRFIVLYFIGC